MQGEMSYLLDCISHLLKVRLLVKVAGHFLSDQCFGHICCAKQNPAAKDLYIALYAAKHRVLCPTQHLISLHWRRHGKQDQAFWQAALALTQKS